MVISAVMVLGLLGLIFGLGLAFASLKLAVEEDPKLKILLEKLPGLNCGACGKAGCNSFAAELLHHKVSVNGCLVGGEKVSKELAHILGVEEKPNQVKRAVIQCGTNFDNRTRIAEYNGVKTCSSALLVQGAGFACPYSCLGFGDCSRVCPFGALRMSNGKPQVNYSKCTGCGICVKTCPRSIISLQLLKENVDLVFVACSSLAKGADVKKICNVGCIGCKICQKNLPDIFEVSNNLARTNYEKANGIVEWDKTINGCPGHTIVKLLDKEQVNNILHKK